MKVRIVGTDEVVEAKRFKDLTDDEIQESTNDPELWRGNEVFIQNSPSNKNHYFFMLDYEIEIIEEKEDTQCQE